MYVDFFTFLRWASLLRYWVEDKNLTFSLCSSFILYLAFEAFLTFSLWCSFVFVWSFTWAINLVSYLRFKECIFWNLNTSFVLYFWFAFFFAAFDLWFYQYLKNRVLLFLYPTQRVAEGMFLTRPSVSQSVSPVFLVRATPLKPLNRISWNFVVMKT